MKVLRYLLVCLASATATSTASGALAADPESATNLQMWCAANNDRVIEQLSCLFYLHGYLDEVRHTADQAPQLKMPCIPLRVTVDEYLKTVVQPALAASNDLSHAAAATWLDGVTRAAYPCEPN